ncbi:MAG: glycosyltransferase family 4 protein [Bacteroidales bacterium]|nr:glycosyltransferase family 4 protein [Bacteroidales bacterium]
MKILMVVETIFTGDTRVENEALSLISAGHEVSVVCRSVSNSSVTETYKNIVLYRIHVSKFILRSSIGILKIPIYSRHWKKAVNKIIRGGDFDVLHIHDLPLVKIGYDLSHIHGLELVLDLHENWPALLNISEHTKTPLGRLLCSIPQWEKYERKYVNRMDKIIVIVEEAKERLINMGVDPGKIFVISNFLKIETLKAFTGKKHINEKLEFVYLGGVTFHRGLQHIINATHLLKKYSDSFLVKIIGDGSYMPVLKSMVQNLSLTNIHFTGWLSDTESFKELSHGDIAIIPHIKSEQTDYSSPHKLFFYMYYGFPIISSDCITIKRIIKEVGAGMTFPSGDSQELAFLMEKFIKTPELINNYTSSRKAVEEKYNWGIEEKKLINLYSLPEQN